MNLTWIDWGIVIVVLTCLISFVIISKKYMQSVADFLSAGRSAGRYLVSVGQYMAGLGSITIVANFEMNYIAGFAMTWWGFIMGVVVLILTVSGWVIYRFRQTRALTMAQFFEIRYSQDFRIFSGILAFLSGIINFGIFPAVGARFFIYFCGLPQTIPIFGIEISTFALIMIIILGLALFFVFSGGQIAVMITDFLQGTFVNIVFIIVVIYLLVIIDFSKIFEALQTAPQNTSLINPFKTGGVEAFNIWYFLIGVFGAIYSTLSWQGTMAYNSSARSAHEAKMGSVLSNWRGIPMALLFLFVPVCAYTVMHHPEFLMHATAVNSVLNTVDAKAIQSQLTVPMVLTNLFPIGLMGAFTAVMLAASIGCIDTYLHSWGSIFIQDVILPLRKKPLPKEQHIRALRLSIFGVVVFIFFFSLLFKQSEYILMFFAITGAIYAGGSGSVIIGGLYWKRGTTAAAWSAMITGSSIAVGGIIIHQLVKDFFINGQWFWLIAMVSAVVVYIAVSLLGRKKTFDMDKLLHRGKYLVKEEYQILNAQPARGLRMLGMGKEFSRSDKVIYIATYVWIFIWAGIFIVGTIYNLTHDVSDLAWMKFWYWYLGINISIAIVVVFWFTIGGIRDVKALFSRLGTMERDDKDDGSVSRTN
ncbi:MAG TPA: sodium:solute symporter [bacterium]